MQRIEALNLVAMLIAAYPSWKPTEETQRLYAGFIEQLDYDVAREVLRGIIESPREFVAPVGLIISRAHEKMRIIERDRQLTANTSLEMFATTRRVEGTWLMLTAICASFSRTRRKI